MRRPHIKFNKGFLRRAGWLSLVILFVITGLGVGVVAFWQNTHQSKDQTSSSNNITCSQDFKPLNQQPKDGKVKGAQLVDFKPPQKIKYLKCVDYKIGTGATATASSLVTVNYVGALASDGKIFDDSFDNNQAFTTSLSQVIPGWSIGVPGMKVGGIRRLYIPAQYAYANQSLDGIPANSDLVFDIQLANLK